MAGPLLYNSYTSNNGNRTGDSNPVLAEDKRDKSVAASGGK